jgi:hypothetical protein
MGFTKFTAGEEKPQPVTPEENQRISRLVKEAGHKSAADLTDEEKEDLHQK